MDYPRITHLVVASVKSNIYRKIMSQTNGKKCQVEKKSSCVKSSNDPRALLHCSPLPGRDFQVNLHRSYQLLSDSEAQTEKSILTHICTCLVLRNSNYLINMSDKAGLFDFFETSQTGRVGNVFYVEFTSP